MSDGVARNIMKNRHSLPSWLREPLVHFLIAGFAVFAFLAWRGEPVDPSGRTIEIDEAKLQQLAERFVQTWRRPPSATEIDGLIRDYIKEEVYYREALRLGLESDDSIIRQRLRSKMEYLAKAQAENVVVDDGVLQQWLDTYPNRYANGARYSFDQIYLRDPADAASVQAVLVQQTDWRSLSAPISLPQSVSDADSKQIARDFGEGFAAALSQIKADNLWVGPIASGFGQHLVRMRTLSAGKKPSLAAVRQSVDNDWRAETAKLREAAAYQALLDGYTITIAKP